jgi:hypothetical protein
MLVLVAICGIVALFLSLTILEHFELITLQALLANLFIVIPANIILGVAYVFLTPHRVVLCRVENWIFTRIISIFTIRPTIWEASFGKALDAFPIGYKAVFKFDVLEIDTADEREQIRKRVQKFPFPMLRKRVAKCCSPGSFPFRIALDILFIPFLAWWLIGFAWIPLISPSTSRATLPPRDECAPREQPKEGAKGLIVQMNIPQCKFLLAARKKYGSVEKGNAACVNE